VGITVVTPWLEHLDLLDDYMAATAKADEVIIVDDGSVPPLSFAAIRLEANQGFCRASNAGLAEATHDKVIFLNNDVVTTDPTWLTTLAAQIEPGVLVGAKLRTEPHAHVPGIQDPLTYIDGWCLGGTRADFELLGGWATTYTEPAYYSDNDLCLRARCLGMRLRECLVPLHHKLSSTTRPGGMGRPGGNQSDPHIQAVTAANYQLYAQRAMQLVGTVAA
jgi:GT2 family glycosyltransferase